VELINPHISRVRVWVWK